MEKIIPMLEIVNGEFHDNQLTVEKSLYIENGLLTSISSISINKTALFICINSTIKAIDIWFPNQSDGTFLSYNCSYQGNLHDVQNNSVLNAMFDTEELEHKVMKIKGDIKKQELEFITNAKKEQEKREEQLKSNPAIVQQMMEMQLENERLREENKELKEEKHDFKDIDESEQEEKIIKQQQEQKETQTKHENVAQEMMEMQLENEMLREENRMLKKERGHFQDIDELGTGEHVQPHSDGEL